MFVARLPWTSRVTSTLALAPWSAITYSTPTSACVASGGEKSVVEENVQDSRRHIWTEAAMRRFGSFIELNVQRPPDDPTHYRSEALTPGYQFVPAIGICVMAEASRVSAHRSSGSRLCRWDLPQARAMIWASIVSTDR